MYIGIYAWKITKQNENINQQKVITILESRKGTKWKYKIYHNVTLPFPWRNELESVREELKRKGDEVKCKLDKSEENVCYMDCCGWLTFKI